MPSTWKTNPIFLVIIAILSLTLCADDWPNWRGPGFNGVSAESDWSHDWPATGPKRHWTAEIGIGYSSVVTAKGRVYASGNTDGNTNTIFCFDETNGKTLWTFTYPCPLLAKYYPGGTHSTPTIHDGRLYTFSKIGDVFCLDAATGKEIWKHNLSYDRPTWGFASSPVISEGLVILNAGKSGIALNKNTGDIVWKSDDYVSSYATPVIYAKDRMAIMNKKTLSGVEASSGKVLWTHPWKTFYGMNASDVLALDGSLIMTSVYNVGTFRMMVADTGLTQQWKTKKVQVQMSGLVHHEGFLYGLNERVKKSKGHLSCFSANTGNVAWTSDAARGTFILAGDRLVLLTLKGELVVARADGRAYTELARAKVLSKGDCWTVPTLSNSKIYCRNHLGTLVCIDVTKIGD
jgi:outer membrane protein assembly factor BamB